MPFTLEIDDARRRVTVTAIGDFMTADAEQTLERPRQGGAWSYGLLYDMRRVTSVPALDDVKRMFALTAEPDPATRSAGRWRWSSPTPGSTAWPAHTWRLEERHGKLKFSASSLKRNGGSATIRQRFRDGVRRPHTRPQPNRFPSPRSPH
jgi:hypothetical protein